MEDTMLNNFRHRDRNDRGASLVEYALLLALIALLCIASLRFLGNSTSDSVSRSTSSMFLG
jgi:Flp pilus assembly pilin Flp